MPFESITCPECEANRDFVMVEPGTYYCPWHKGLFKYVDSSPKLSTSGLGLCACGTRAIGLCQECGQAFCEDHSKVIGAGRYCSAHQREAFFANYEQSVARQLADQDQITGDSNRLAWIMNSQTIGGNPTFKGKLRILEGHREDRPPGWSAEVPQELSDQDALTAQVREAVQAAPILARQLKAKNVPTGRVLNLHKGEHVVRGERKGLVREKRREYILEFIAAGWPLLTEESYDSDSRNSRGETHGVILATDGKIIRYSGFSEPRSAGAKYSQGKPQGYHPFVTNYGILSAKRPPTEDRLGSVYKRLFSDFYYFHSLMLNMVHLAHGNGVKSDLFS
jgi:hypothetical protein